MSISTYWTLATRTLLRDRLRTLLAIICVTAGVMSIVALQLTTLSATSVLVAPGRLSEGGDLVVQSDLFPLSDSQLARIDQFKAQGLISAYTPIKIVSAQGVNAQGTTTTFNVCVADMTKFPLSGKVDFLTPPQGNLRVLVHGNSVVVRKDFLKALKVHAGDEVAVATDDGRAIRVTISGVVQNTPPFYGLSDAPLMLIAADTYKTLPSSSNQQLTYTHIYVDVPGHSDAAIARLLPQLQQTFPSALVQPSQQAEQRNRMNATGFRHLLQLAGLLALLIGGLGISNTVAVLLRRRTLEIATLKTLGYKQHSLLLLFGLEVGLIGLVGGVPGSIIGAGLSFFLRGLLEQFLAFSLPTMLDPLTILSGVAIGLSQDRLHS